MPRTGLNAEQLRERVIDATLTKMREVGLEKVRLTDIAKELQVSHAALYFHFKDKSDLVDAVSEIWLLKLDETLESICRRRKNPAAKIHDWALAIHRAKIEKVLLEPELYKSFGMASEQLKPYVKRHLENLHRQLSSLVKEAIAKNQKNNANAEEMTKIIAAAMMAFHHPKMVAFYINEKREKLLHQVLDSVLRGLDLET